MDLDQELKPFKITDSQRERKIGIVAKSLEDLKCKAQEKFNLKSNIKIVLEADGTEIDEEDYFSTLENNTLLMILIEAEKWMPVRYVNDVVDGIGHPLIELLTMLKQDIGNVSLLGGKELELLSDMDPNNLLDIIPDKFFLNQVKEASARFLSDKRQAQEALDLLKLYHNSYINNGHDNDTNSNVKKTKPNQ